MLVYLLVLAFPAGASADQRLDDLASRLAGTPVTVSCQGNAFMDGSDGFVWGSSDDDVITMDTTIYLRGWCDTTGAEHAAGLDECKRRLQQAAELGAIHSIASPAGGKVDVALAARNYRELVELGLSFGVKPAMEYLGFVDQLNTIESALEIMTLGGHPQSTIVVDPFHNFRGGGSFASLAKLRGDQIAISHFNDTPASPPRLEQHDHSRVLPGEGHLDLKPWVGLLRQIGYSGWLSLELFNEALWARDPKEVATRGLETMRAAVEA